MTYDNEATGVVHWIDQSRILRTACRFLSEKSPSWKMLNLDLCGVPEDVTCRHCREKKSFLDAVTQA